MNWVCTCMAVLLIAKAGRADWPMLAHDAARSGATPVEIRPPFARKWYRLFPDEGLMSGVQPIVANGRVFLGTMAGRLYALDEASGRELWQYQAGGAILHSCAASEGRVFFCAADGGVYALSSSDAQLLWKTQTGAALWNSPLLLNETVYVGGRDSILYALAARDGHVRWKAPVGGPILASPAADTRSRQLYAAAEDMRVYAFDLETGSRRWESSKLPGVSFRGYHPVIAPDGSVMVTVTPCVALDTCEAILHDMVREIFGDFASWRHSKEENERLRRENFALLEQPQTYQQQLDYLRRRLNEQPAYQTFFILDGQTGQQRCVVPIVYAESMNGTGAPAVVTSEGQVIVKYQALLRSRYGHYSPFLNVGYLDTATGHITPVMDQSRTYGWHDSLLLVHDEQCQLSVAGRLLINTHQDNVNALDLDTRVGFSEPFCRNIHEPRPGEAVGIWQHLLHDRPLPVGKEWLARGTAVYGGGSVLGVPVSVAGDSFYYIPTHEMSAGAAVIAYRMQPGGDAARERPAPVAELSGEDWERIQALPWDWDMLGTARQKHVLDSLPGRVPGTREEPLTRAAVEVVEQISDEELDAYVWQIRHVSLPATPAVQPLRDEIGQRVREVISGDWQPLIFPPGKHPLEAYRIFIDPTQTLATLAGAYPHLDAELQQAVREYVLREQAAGRPLSGPTGQATYSPETGKVRSAYDPAPTELLKLTDDIRRSELARLYPIWLWAHASGDWSAVERHWGRLRELVRRDPNRFEEDCHNGHLAGLIAYCRLARQMQDEAAVSRGLTAARAALRERLRWELAHHRGGLLTQVPVLRTIFARWRHLTPEVGRLLAAYSRPAHERLMAVQIDYHRPTWWLAWNVELNWRNEAPFAFPTMSAEVFAARALILDESPAALAATLDIPWCRADLYYLDKLVLCLEAHGSAEWR